MIYWGLYEFVCTYKMNPSNDYKDVALLSKLLRWISIHDGIPLKVTRFYYILQAVSIDTTRFDRSPLLEVVRKVISFLNEKQLMGYRILS